MASSPADSAAGQATPESHWQARAAQVQRLSLGLRELEVLAGPLQVAPLAGREWYEQLTRKLGPQLGRASFLVVAVVGGTNIGKSVVFNHLAGSMVSAVTPLASGTKHPMCLVPEGFPQRMNLREVFPGFEIIPWRDPDSLLEAHAEDRLYWMTANHLPANLLVLDTPDIDSDAPVNWERADHIRHCSDVLIAVLTQQKYNDAAIKEFFRKAREEAKAVIVIFNRCQFPEDETYWPKWLETFCAATGISPLQVYVAPHDRNGATTNALPFFPRNWPVGTGVREESVACQLPRELSQLHFETIKRETLDGAFQQVLDANQGAPSYLQEVKSRSREYETLAEHLNTQRIAELPSWPALPSHLLVHAIRTWWRGEREGWTRSVHDFYNTLGEGILKPIGWAYERWAGPQVDPKEAYLQAERDAIMNAVERLYQGLSGLRNVESSLIKNRLDQLLGGPARERFLQQVTTAHAQLNLEQEIDRVVAVQMQEFRKDSPQMYEFLKKLDSFAAAARPVTSAVLFFVGGVPGVDMILHETATQAALHVVSGAGTVVVGEAALTGTTSGLRIMEAKFRQLETAITTRRITWLAELLQLHLLGPLQQEIDAASRVSESATFRNVEQALEDLRRPVA
ncbi:MAG: GTPase [Planctomycetales bacterium]